MSEFSFYVGIDLSNTKQTLAVIDDGRKTLLQKTVDTHEVRGVLRSVIGDALAKTIAVGVEDRNNALVDALIDDGYAVHVINPFQSDKFRARTTASGAKDDKRDALVLARALLSDIECFRRVEALNANDEELKVFSRHQAHLAEDFRRHANQLLALLGRYCSGLLVLCSGADEAWFWELVELGDVDRLRRMRPSTFAKLLTKHRKRNVSVEDIQRALSLDHPRPASSASYASHQVVMGVVEQLRLTHKQMKAMVAMRDKRVMKDPQSQVLLSMPGVGAQTAATILAEAGEHLREGALPQLRAVFGVAPVSIKSGKSSRVVMRRACNERLRDAIFHAAFAASRSDEQFKAYRKRQEERGLKGARMLRNVGDKMLGILVAMMRSNTPYRSTRTA